MIAETKENPAERASQQCLEKVYTAIDEKKHFLVEAGAGAGKTYTLVKALKYLIDKNEKSFIRTGKKIACITYTNVATEEIKSRIDNHPIIIADTIHGFAWQAIKAFQKSLRERISELSENWIKRIEDAGGVVKQEVIYNLGYPKMDEKKIYLHHNDVIKLFTSLLKDNKFKQVFSSRYPVILIDEYQDTNKALTHEFITHFIDSESSTLIGFFGDHWQQIYGSDSCGLIEVENGNLEIIGKHANFRSDKCIVDALNKMRPNLKQFESDPESKGEIYVLHTNNWDGERLGGQHWKGDLPATVAHDFLEATKIRLKNIGWNISPETTKVLMLTNNVLASEQGYKTIASTFSETDDYLKKNDDYISFLTETIEVGSEAFEQKKYGILIKAFKINTQGIRKHSDKQSWHDSLVHLNELRRTGTIGNVIDYLRSTGIPKLTRKIEEKEQQRIDIEMVQEENRTVEQTKFFKKINMIRAIPYPEISNVSKYIEDKTIYSTKHGVKGAEFENVIVVLGRGWNLYNWNQFLEWVYSGSVKESDKDAFERNRNLFYMACSRSRKRLCLLFTQKLSPSAFSALEYWFGNVISEIRLK